MNRQPKSPVSTKFYTDIKPCSSFEAIGDLRFFHRLPDDWHIVIGDIRDSTPAIAAGRYKEVNMIGASCIIAAINAVPELDIAYVFGGDGATIGVPSEGLMAIRSALLKLRSLAATSFNLDLRVGLVSVAAIRASGQDVQLAKLEISPGNHVAMFAGGGVELADQLIKADDTGANGFAQFEDAEPDPDLDGLSCRWEPLGTQRGQMVSMLIRTRAGKLADAARIYDSVLKDLSTILGADQLAGRPIRPANMKFRWPPREMGTEATLTKGKKPRWRRLIEIWISSVIQLYLERFNTRAGGYNAPIYREELRTNTDYRRFDGTLRLIVDCTDDELNEVNNMLDRRYKNGEIHFGVHTADTALMTCLVFDLAASRHLHFVDGNDGGFAVAAKGLKAQIATNRPL